MNLYVQAIFFLFVKILVFSCMLYILRFLIWCVRNIIFGCVLLLFPGLRQKNRLDSLVFGDREFCRFSLGNMSVYLQGRRIILRMGSSRLCFHLSPQSSSVCWFLVLVSPVRRRSQFLSGISRLGRGLFCLFCGSLVQ